MITRNARFISDDRGHVALWFAFLALPLMLCIGLAIDYARLLRLQTQLQIVADAGTAAGLKAYRETGDLKKGQERLLSFIDEGLKKDGLVRASDDEDENLAGKLIVEVDGMAIDPETSSVRPILKTSVETPFMKLIGTAKVDIEVATKGAVASDILDGDKDSKGDKFLEVSLMLDVSGSMKGQKIKDLIDASKHFIDIVIPSDAASKRRVGLVPFSDRVNVGSYAAAATGLAPTAQIQTWFQVVRVFDASSTASWIDRGTCRSRVRSITEFSTYSDPQAEAHCNDTFQNRVSSGQTQFLVPAVMTRTDPVFSTRFLRTCVTERQGTERYTDAVAGPGTYVGAFSPGSDLPMQYTTSETNNCSIPEIKTLTTDKESLKKHIDTFKPLGGTAGHLGTAWSYYMLSPEWNRFWNTGHVDVAAYDNTDTIKSAVLMTDGEYNFNWSEPGASAQAIALCNEMKAKGIIVYTIGFDMNPIESDSARQTLMACASPGKYYFPYDGDALKAAFNAIGRSLVTIVTKSSDRNTVLIQE